MEKSKVQVVENVDMVKGKTTLIRVIVSFVANDTNATIIPNVTIHWNDTLIRYNDTQNMSHGEELSFDFWHIPQDVGDVEVMAEVEGTYEGEYLSDSRDHNVDVVETHKLNIGFVPVDWEPQLNFNAYKKDVLQFMNSTYPLSDDGFNITDHAEIATAPVVGVPFVPALLLQIRGATQLSSNEYPDRSVGIVPPSWFFQHGLGNSKGFAISSRLLQYAFPAVVLEAGRQELLAHEIGHTYFLCDENVSEWNDQNTETLSDNLCPNGDSNPDDEILDLECQTNKGCPTETIKELIPWPGSNGSEMKNFMGYHENQFTKWVSSNTYNHLINMLKNSTPDFSTSRILVSGFYNKSSEKADFQNFYILGDGFVENKSQISGNFSIEMLDNQSNMIYNITFPLAFFITLYNGSSIETNVTPFIFALPLESNISQINFVENDTIKDQVNKSFNPPSINITFPNGGELFNNQEINISWEANDSDGDNLTFSVLISNDGINYNTIAYDTNQTFFIYNSTSLADGKEYLVKVLVSDGFNTNNDTSDNVFEIDNDLNITELSVIYENSTERMFRFVINNTLGSNISNISFSLDTGEITEYSQYSITLRGGEDIFVYVYYNYTVTGIYTVIATARSGEFVEVESMNIGV
ncbi:MAG: hypothetical protein ABIJ92_02935 [Candidatus Aenigmatarchaeota archaeon]